MEKKTSLFFRYMKYWYGIYGPLDEYKRSEVERIGNNAFHYLFTNELCNDTSDCC